MNKWALAGITAGVTILADQATKWAVLTYLAPIHQVKVIPGFFDLTFVQNSGVAFGMLGGERHLLRVWGLIGFTIAALGLIAYFIKTANVREKLFVGALGLIAGGAAGNAIDRGRLGAVIDFLDFYYHNQHWPAFNIADMSITIGTAAILLHLWLHREEKGREGD